MATTAPPPMKTAKQGVEEEGAQLQKIRITLSCMNNIKNLEKGKTSMYLEGDHIH